MLRKSVKIEVLFEKSLFIAGRYAFIKWGNLLLKDQLDLCCLAIYFLCAQPISDIMWVRCRCRVLLLWRTRYWAKAGKKTKERQLSGRQVAGSNYCFSSVRRTSALICTKLSIGGAKLSYRRGKIVLGDNFFDLLSKFFRSPKRDFSLIYSEKF